MAPPRSRAPKVLLSICTSNIWETRVHQRRRQTTGCLPKKRGRRKKNLGVPRKQWRLAGEHQKRTDIKTIQELKRTISELRANSGKTSQWLHDQSRCNLEQKSLISPNLMAKKRFTCLSWRAATARTNLREGCRNYGIYLIPNMQHATLYVFVTYIIKIVMR